MAKPSKKILTESQQLYIPLQTLSRLVGDEGDFGRMVGYNIINQISSYNFKSSSPEERAFTEIRLIRKGFINLALTVSTQEFYYPSLGLLQQETEPLLIQLNKITIPPEEEIFEGPSSLLFYELVETLQSQTGNLLDKLKNRGLQLKRTVLERGMVQGNKNSLLKDHRDVRYCFVRRRGDRRE